MYTQKKELQQNLPTPAQWKRRGEGQTDPQTTAGGKDPPKKVSARTQNQRHTQSQHKPQPKIINIRRSRKLYRRISQVFYHRSSHHNPGGQNRAT